MSILNGHETALTRNLKLEAGELMHKNQSDDRVKNEFTKVLDDNVFSSMPTIEEAGC